MLRINYQDIFAESDMSTHTFYETYTINVPYDNYVIIGMRSFGPNNYILLNMNSNEILIYSPYEDEGLLFQRKLSEKEIFSIFTIFQSEEYINIPEKNDKIAFDATEIDITSSIKKVKKHMHHVIPDNKIVKEIIDLYNKLNVIENK